MIDQKVVVLATGGTIAMKYDPKLKSLVPACTGEDLAAAVPGLGEVAPLEFIQFSNVASPAMTPQTELRSSLRNFESQNEYGYKPCIKRRFQNAETELRSSLRNFES